MNDNQTKFDPMTGQPIQNNPTQPNIDPMAGQPQQDFNQVNAQPEQNLNQMNVQQPQQEFNQVNNQQEQNFNQMNIQQPQQNFNQVNAQPEQPAKKSSSGTVVIVIIVVVVLALVAVAVLFLLGVIGSSSKLVCESSEGNITLLYNEKEIVGYTSTGRLSYDLEGQKAIAERIGVEEYMYEFEIWFKTNTTGTCKRK